MAERPDLDKFRAAYEKHALGGPCLHLYCAETLALLAYALALERQHAAIQGEVCGSWHCSGHRRCEFERGHEGDHFTTSLGANFPAWDDSASVDVPKLLEVLDEANRNAWSRARAEWAEETATLARDLGAANEALKRAQMTLGHIAYLERVSDTRLYKAEVARIAAAAIAAGEGGQ